MSISRVSRVSGCSTPSDLSRISTARCNSGSAWAYCPSLCRVCIDSTTGEDMAEELRGYFIPDFSNWKSHDDLERALARLPADLKVSA